MTSSHRLKSAVVLIAFLLTLFSGFAYAAPPTVDFTFLPASPTVSENITFTPVITSSTDLNTMMWKFGADGNVNYFRTFTPGDGNRFLYDDFSDGELTTNPKWYVSLGTGFSVDTNLNFVHTAVGATGGQQINTFWPDANTTNFDFNYMVKTTYIDSGNAFQINLVDTNSFVYRLEWVNNGADANKFILSRNNGAGTATTLVASGTKYSLVDNWYTVSVVKRDSNISLYVDTNYQGSATDTNATFVDTLSITANWGTGAAIDSNILLDKITFSTGVGGETYTPTAAIDMGLTQVHAFGSAGVHQVCLTAGNADGNVTDCDNVTVTASSSGDLTFQDDFSGYSSSFKVLSDTNLLDVTSFDQDANEPISKATSLAGDGVPYNLNWIDLNSLFVPVDVSLNAANASRVILKLDQAHMDILDYYLNEGKIHFILNIDSNNTTGMSVYLRLGHSTANYYEFRKSYAQETSWWVGRHDISWQLNDVNVEVGTPSYNDVNMAWIIVNHDAGQTDYNWTINGIWVEMPGGFNDTSWEIASPNVNPQGVGVINPNNQLVLNTIDRESYGYHGRIFAKQFDDLNLANQQLSLEADINIVDANWGSRIMYDYVDGDDFTGCFIFYATPTSLRYGVEQWVANVRDFNQVTATSAYGINKEMRCTTSGATGLTTNLYIDDVLVATKTFANPRRDGRVAIESFSQHERHGGKIRIDNVNFSAESISVTPDSPGDSTSSAGYRYPLFETLVRLLAFPLAFLFLLFLFVKGELGIQEVVFGMILTFIAFILFNALFFQVPI